MKFFNPAFLILAFSAMGCAPIQGDEDADPESSFVPASSISSNGFAISKKRIEALHGRKVKVFGFVDYSNVFKDSRDGRGIHPNEWRFNIKERSDASAGESFAVRVMKDGGGNEILKVIEKNELAGEPTKIYVVGEVFTFEAPTNFTRLTGLYMKVRSTLDISFENPGAAKRNDSRTAW